MQLPRLLRRCSSMLPTLISLLAVATIAAIASTNSTAAANLAANAPISTGLTFTTAAQSLNSTVFATHPPDSGDIPQLSSRR